jgi:CHAD domain-containing protein
MTRRIEGQLALLGLLPGVPDYGKPADKARKLLKRLRRAAGEVRDIDVQIDLIESVAPAGSSRPLKEDGAKLRESLEEDRKDTARKLGKVLSRRQSALTLALEETLYALKPVEELALSATKLASLAQQWFAHNAPSQPKGGEDADHLHSIRKVAKLARYMAENAPKSAKRPRHLAGSFERLQQSGGEWHDWLVLATIARERLGGSSALTLALDERSQAALGSYRDHLREMVIR